MSVIGFAVAFLIVSICFIVSEHELAGFSLLVLVDSDTCSTSTLKVHWLTSELHRLAIFQDDAGGEVARDIKIFDEDIVLSAFESRTIKVQYSPTSEVEKVRQRGVCATEASKKAHSNTE